MLGFFSHEGFLEAWFSFFKSTDGHRLRRFFGFFFEMALLGYFTRRREDAKTRSLEGECPHEPPSAVRKDGCRFHCGAPGGASVTYPLARDFRLFRLRFFVMVETWSVNVSDLVVRQM